MTEERCDKSERLSRDLDIVRLQACDSAKDEAEQVLRREAKIAAGPYQIQGRRPRGALSGRFPQQLQVGDGPCIRPPNILRSSVVGCARKYEQSKKRCHKGNSGCSCEEGVIYDIDRCKKIRKIWEKKGKVRKTWSIPTKNTL